MPSFHIILFINIKLVSLLFVLVSSTNSSENLRNNTIHPVILDEIYQVAKPYGFNQSFEIDRPYFAFIRNKADLEDSSHGSTMNSCFFTGILYIFAKVPPFYETDIQEAVIWLRKAAIQGHRGAQCTMGIIYFHGIKYIQKDRNMAMRWFYQAVQSRDNRRAHWLLARSLYEGKTYEERDLDNHVPHIGYNNETVKSGNSTHNQAKNMTEITRLLLFVTDTDSELVDEDPIPEAFHLLGMMCEYGLVRWEHLISYRGKSHPKSRLFKSMMSFYPKSHYEIAAELYHHAVELDYAESMYHLGLMYAYGRGVQLNYAKAVDFFRRAALEYYHAPSMRYLGIFAFKGYGTPKNEIDFVMAEYWFRHCIEWSENSASSFTWDDKNIAENWMNQLCTKELEEVTSLFQKTLYIHSKNWSIETGHTI